MSEILLQLIVEKLESFEIALLKKNSDTDPALQTLLQETKLLRSSTTKLPSKLEDNFEKMNELLRSIRELNFNLNRPTNEQIKHSHHLHKGIWIAVGLFIVSFLLLFGWINCYNAKKILEANDIKYRYLKVNGNVPLLKLLYQTDSLYNLNKDSFAKAVLARQSILDQADRFRSPGEKKKNAARLKK